jgi:muramoyltetrapeptide carboxypeptidase
MHTSRFALPRALPHGGTIGIFSASGAPAPLRVAQGVATLEAAGYRCVVAPHATESYEYFSAPDDIRLADFHQMLADPAIDMMMMSRGGYGLSRIVHRIDWAAVAASKKILCGFSDFTALNLGALARANLITLAGPGVATDFGEDSPDSEAQDAHNFMQSHFWPVARGESVSVDVATPHPYQGATLSGTLWGSNLSLLCDLGGSSFIPDIQGGILFIEEIGEKPYAVERMFLQLYHAGVLSQQKAIVLGEFTDCEPAADRYPYSMQHVINTLRTLLPVPVLTDLPFGHVARKLTLPYGADATLVINDGGYTLNY